MSDDLLRASKEYNDAETTLAESDQRIEAMEKRLEEEKKRNAEIRNGVAAAKQRVSDAVTGKAVSFAAENAEKDAVQE